MAVIQYTAIVNQIRGKLNGSVFNKSRNAYTLQRKQQPTKKLTAFQSRQRAIFSSVQRAWKGLDATQRAVAQLSAQNNPTRDRFGQEVILSGYNHWVKANLIRRQVNASMVNTMVTTSGVSLSLVLDTVGVFFNTNPNGRVTIDAGVVFEAVAVQRATYYALAYISYPKSPGVTAYSGRWFFAGSFLTPTIDTSPAPLEMDFVNLMPPSYPRPTGNQEILMRFDFWQTDRGALVQSIITGTPWEG